jgi:hypothetical protein
LHFFHRACPRRGVRGGTAGRGRPLPAPSGAQTLEARSRLPFAAACGDCKTTARQPAARIAAAPGHGRGRRA